MYEFVKPIFHFMIGLHYNINVLFKSNSYIASFWYHCSAVLHNILYFNDMINQILGRGYARRSYKDRENGSEESANILL